MRLTCPQLALVSEALRGETSGERHMGVDADPAPIGLAVQADGCAAGAVEPRAVAMEAGASPGGNDNGHGAVRADEDFGIGRGRR